MALQRFKIEIPTKYLGLMDFVQPELKEFSIELIRRLSRNQDAIVNALRDQVVVDTNVLTAMDRGEDAGTTNDVATTNDTDDAVIEALFLQG